MFPGNRALDSQLYSNSKSMVNLQCTEGDNTGFSQATKVKKERSGSNIFSNTINKLSKRERIETVPNNLETQAIASKVSSEWNLHSFCFFKQHSTEKVSTPGDQYEDIGKYLPFDLNGEVPESILQMAREKLGEKAETREIVMKQLRDLIAEKKMPFKTDDYTILLFLRAKKFDVNKAFQKMEHFYKYKADIHDRYISPEEVESHMKLNLNRVGPLRDSKGRTVSATILGSIDPSKDFSRGTAVAAMALMRCLEQTATQITGIVWIADCKNMSWMMARHLSLKNTIMVFSVYMKALPIRYEEIHVLNESNVVYYIVKFIETFLPRKFKKRIYFHGNDLSSLHKHVSKSLLPPEYGGVCTGWVIFPTAEQTLNTKIYQ